MKEFPKLSKKKLTTYKMIYHVQTSVDTRTWTYFHSVNKTQQTKLLNSLCTRLLKITTPSTSGEEGLADPQVQGCQQEGSKGRSGASKATPNCSDRKKVLN